MLLLYIESQNAENLTIPTSYGSLLAKKIQPPIVFALLCWREESATAALINPHNRHSIFTSCVFNIINLKLPESDESST